MALGLSAGCCARRTPPPPLNCTELPAPPHGFPPTTTSKHGQVYMQAHTCTAAVPAARSRPSGHGHVPEAPLPATTEALGRGGQARTAPESCITPVLCPGRQLWLMLTWQGAEKGAGDGLCSGLPSVRVQANLGKGRGSWVTPSFPGPHSSPLRLWAHGGLAAECPWASLLRLCTDRGRAPPKKTPPWGHKDPSAKAEGGTEVGGTQSHQSSRTLPGSH